MEREVQECRAAHAEEQSGLVRWVCRFVGQARTDAKCRCEVAQFEVDEPHPGRSGGQSPRRWRRFGGTVGRFEGFLAAAEVRRHGGGAVQAVEEPPAGVRVGAPCRREQPIGVCLRDGFADSVEGAQYTRSPVRRRVPAIREHLGGAREQPVGAFGGRGGEYTGCQGPTQRRPVRVGGEAVQPTRVMVGNAEQGSYDVLVKVGGGHWFFGGKRVPVDDRSHHGGGLAWMPLPQLGHRHQHPEPEHPQRVQVGLGASEVGRRGEAGCARAWGGRFIKG
ncbi:hypothetical protein [Embleya sp. NPDC059237]|uniref:hypothetical protein n=1 Tax=Embleya sp. NPDC059237 TaxID=3346784 RepID=UPI003681FF02